MSLPFAKRWWILIHKNSDSRLGEAHTSPNGEEDHRPAEVAGEAARDGDAEEALAHIATGTERGAAALPRFSSLDALYSASILVDRRPRSDSHGSTGLGFEDGLFYDDDAAPFAFTDDQAPTI